MGVGSIVAHSIYSKHISTDWITAKYFRTGAGVQWGAGLGTQGVMFQALGIMGKDNAGVTQFFLDSADGMGYFAAGKAIMSATGLRLDGGIVALWDAAGVALMGNLGILTHNLSDWVTLSAVAGNDVLLFAPAGQEALVYGGALTTIYSDTGNIQSITTALTGGHITFSPRGALLLGLSNTGIIIPYGDIVTADISPNIRTATGNVRLHWWDDGRVWYFDGLNSGAGAGVAGPNLHIRGDAADSVPSVQFFTETAAIGDTLEMSIFSDGLTNVISAWQPSTALALHVYGDAGAPDTALRLDFEAPAAASGIDTGDTSFSNTAWFRLFPDTKITQKFAVNVADGNVYVHNNIQPNVANSHAVGTAGAPFLSVATNYLSTLYIQPKSGSTAIIIQDDDGNSRFTFTDLESGSTDWALIPIANGAGHVGTSGSAFKSMSTNYLATKYMQPLSGNTAIIIQDDDGNSVFDLFDLEHATDYSFRPIANGAGILGGPSKNWKRAHLQVVATISVGATLGVGATTFPATNDVIEITGDGGGNNISTINGGTDGQRITIIFRDGLVTMVDTAAPAAGTLSLSGGGNWNPNAQDTLELVFDGTSWYEMTRSAN